MVMGEQSGDLRFLSLSVGTTPAARGREREGLRVKSLIVYLYSMNAQSDAKKQIYREYRQKKKYM